MIVTKQSVIFTPVIITLQTETELRNLTDIFCFAEERLDMLAYNLGFGVDKDAPLRQFMKDLTSQIGAA